MNLTPSRPTLTLAGRRRLETELERLRDRLNETTERLKQELRDTDDLTWYSTQDELALTRSRIGELEAALLAEPDGTLSLGTALSPWAVLWRSKTRPAVNIHF